MSDTSDSDIVKRTPKGILRNSISSQKDDTEEECLLTTGACSLPNDGHAHFDETNILQTHHPGAFHLI